MKVQIKKIHPEAIIPEYKKTGDAGFDFYIIENATIQPYETVILKTGLSVAIPEGYEMQIRMRSGASIKTPLIIPNAPGTIDSGYRGEIGIIVRNLSHNPYEIKKGERLAQGVIIPVIHAEFEEVNDLPVSDRGKGGFGSTGN